jgi:hypothetical protein
MVYGTHGVCVGHMAWVLGPGKCTSSRFFWYFMYFVHKRLWGPKKVRTRSHMGMYMLKIMYKHPKRYMGPLGGTHTKSYGCYGHVSAFLGDFLLFLTILRHFYQECAYFWGTQKVKIIAYMVMYMLQIIYKHPRWCMGPPGDTQALPYRC